MGVVQERKRAREKRDSERKDSTNTWMGVVQERKREERDQRKERREIMNTKAERTPELVLRRDVGREVDMLQMGQLYDLAGEQVVTMPNFSF